MDNIFVSNLFSLTQSTCPYHEAFIYLTIPRTRSTNIHIIHMRNWGLKRQVTTSPKFFLNSLCNRIMAFEIRQLISTYINFVSFILPYHTEYLSVWAWLVGWGFLPANLINCCIYKHANMCLPLPKHQRKLYSHTQRSITMSGQSLVNEENGRKRS